MIHSPPELSYRAATSADVPAMEQCRAADRQSGPADARMTAYLDGHHHPQLALTPRTAFVALAGNDVAGYIAAHATTRHGCSGEIQYLYVAPQFRRLGVARRLVRLVARWFQNQRIHRVCVNADVESVAAVAFYSAEGAVPLNTYWYTWDNIGTLLDTTDGRR